MSSKKSVTSEEKTKTYIMDLNNGTVRKVTVPANWKLTFGPTIPYSGKGSTSIHGGGTALRFYEGNKENLRAAFTDVRAFRDADMPVQERRTQIQKKTIQKDAHGGTKNVEVEARITEWVNPDDVEDSEQAAQPFLNMIGGAPISFDND